MLQIHFEPNGTIGSCCPLFQRFCRQAKVEKSKSWVWLEIEFCALHSPSSCLANVSTSMLTLSVSIVIPLYRSILPVNMFAFVLIVLIWFLKGMYRKSFKWSCVLHRKSNTKSKLSTHRCCCCCTKWFNFWLRVWSGSTEFWFIAYRLIVSYESLTLDNFLSIGMTKVN